MMSGRRVVDGIGVLGAEHLIPFKMYAWINLLDRKRAGEHVNEKDLKKHKVRCIPLVADCHSWNKNRIRRAGDREYT